MDSSDEKSGKEWFAVLQDFLYEKLLADSELGSGPRGATNGTQWIREKGSGVRRHIAGQLGRATWTASHFKHCVGKGSKHSSRRRPNSCTKRAAASTLNGAAHCQLRWEPVDFFTTQPAARIDMVPWFPSAIARWYLEVEKADGR